MTPAMIGTDTRYATDEAGYKDSQQLSKRDGHL
jgi:hypothetical protein